MSRPYKCTYSLPKSDSGDLSGTPLTNGNLKIYFFAPDGSKSVRRTDQDGVLTQLKTIHKECPDPRDSGDFPNSLAVGPWAVSSGYEPIYVEATGDKIHGQLKAKGKVVTDWTFKAPVW